MKLSVSPTIPAFERAKTVHALNRAATVIGKAYLQGLFKVEEFIPVDELKKGHRLSSI
jgi:hypothetical protein